MRCHGSVMTPTPNSLAGVRSQPAFRRGARIGYAANGVLNLLIGWLALQVAWGGGGQEASATGALQTLAGEPLGSVLLWLLLVGFVLLGLWQLTEAVVGGDTGDRLKAAAKGVVYLTLGFLTLTVVTGSGGSGGTESQWTATLMQQPFGRVLVGVVGLGVIGVGAYHVHKGWTRKFLRDLEENPGRWAERAGRAGYVARGVAFGVVGGLFVTAAVTADPQQAQGLDGALQTLRNAPAGQILLTLVALGFVAYGLYSFARARHGRV